MPGSVFLFHVDPRSTGMQLITHTNTQHQHPTPTPNTNTKARPTVVAAAFFIGAWCISVPLSYVFCFVLHKDLLGLWYGMTCGYLVVTLIAGVAVLRSNWTAIMAAAVLRSRSAAGPAIPSINHIHDDAAGRQSPSADERTPLLAPKLLLSPGFEADDR